MRRLGPCAALLLAACGTDGVIHLLAQRGDAATAAEDGANGADAGASDAANDVVTPADTGPPCDGGACPCGLTECSGVCVDLQNDPNHCGSCGAGLLHFQVCRAGQPECLPGFTFCNGACRDFASDPDHCGACSASVCTTGAKCENGVCGTGACGAPLTGCPASDNRLSCVDLSRGTPKCGDCSNACGPDQVCVNGHCRGYSPATPCLACPCAGDCARVQGSPATCCPGLAGIVQPICVHDTSCP